MTKSTSTIFAASLTSTAVEPMTLEHTAETNVPAEVVCTASDSGVRVGDRLLCAGDRISGPAAQLLYFVGRSGFEVLTSVPLSAAQTNGGLVVTPAEEK